MVTSDGNVPVVVVLDESMVALAGRRVAIEQDRAIIV